MSDRGPDGALDPQREDRLQRLLDAQHRLKISYRYPPCVAVTRMIDPTPTPVKGRCAYRRAVSPAYRETGSRVMSPSS